MRPRVFDGVETVGEVGGPQFPRLIYNGQGAKLTKTPTDKCSLLSFHTFWSPVTSGNTHTALELKANYTLREMPISFAYSCENIVLLIIKVLVVLLLVIYLSSLILKKKTKVLLKRIFKVGKYP